jgi:hypothetical protein
LPLASETRVEEEGNRFAEAEFGETGMGGIEEKVEFGGDDDAGDLEDERGGASEPGIADGASASRGRIGAPVLRKGGQGEALDDVRRDGDGDGEIVAEEFFGIEMDEDFESSERLGLRGVNDGAARRVPAATEEARPFPSKGDLGESAVDDAPNDRVHRKMATLTGRRRARAGR